MSTITFPLLNIARHRMGTDGAGITTLVASAGCPLRCEFCINKKLYCSTILIRNKKSIIYMNSGKNSNSNFPRKNKSTRSSYSKE